MNPMSEAERMAWAVTYAIERQHERNGVNGSAIATELQADGRHMNVVWWWGTTDTEPLGGDVLERQDGGCTVLYVLDWPDEQAERWAGTLDIAVVRAFDPAENQYSDVPLGFYEPDPDCFGMDYFDMVRELEYHRQHHRGVHHPGDRLELNEKHLCSPVNHDWMDTGSYANPDSAEESLTCRRCGEHFQHVWY